MTSNARTYTTPPICGVGTTITVAAGPRGNRRLVRLISAVQVSFSSSTPPALSCTTLNVTGNGEPNVAAVAPGSVRLNGGVQNQLVFGSPLTASDMVFLVFESDDTGTFRVGA